MIDNGETVVQNDACVQTGSAPVNRVFCGNSTINRVVMDLRGGNDRVEQSGYNNGFVVLGSLTVDFGAGSDSNSGDWIDLPISFSGGEGEDNIAGGLSAGTLNGGPGNDRLFGGAGNEVIHGGAGDDDVNGQSGNDEIFGDDGNDSLVGSAGGDSITGGAGRDNVQGDAAFLSSNGNDTLYLVDGEVDSAPGPGASPGAVSLGKPARVSAANRRVITTVNCPAMAAGRCRGTAAFKIRFTEPGRKRSVSLGKAFFDLEPGRSAKVRRTLSRKLYARLRKAKKRKLSVSATSRDASGAAHRSSGTWALVL